MGPPDISIRIYQSYLVSSGNAPQEVYIDVTLKFEKINVNPGGGYNEPVLYVDLTGGNRRLSTCGIVYKPNKYKGIECYVYADFSGGWAQSDSDNVENSMSRTGYVITYAGCPVLWCSKIQRETSLSTTEAGYIALMHSIHGVINFMEMMKEV